MNVGFEIDGSAFWGIHRLNDATETSQRQSVRIGPSNAVSVVNSTRPKAGKILSQGLRLADTLERMPQSIFDQKVNSLQRFPIPPLPPDIVFPSGSGFPMPENGERRMSPINALIRVRTSALFSRHQR